MSADVRVQHSLCILSSMGSSRIGREMAWQFFKDHFNIFNERFNGIFLMVRLIQSLTQHFVTEEKAIEIQSFFKVNFFPAHQSK